MRLLAAGNDASAMAALGIDSHPLLPSERIAMESSELVPGLIGRQVRILTWADYGELFRHFSRYGPIPPEPVGTVTGVDDYGTGYREIRLQIAGFPRPFVFDAYELELLF